MMKAIGTFKGGAITDSEALVDLTLERPTPQSRDILVQVQAVSVNPVDTKLRQAIAPSDTPTILGYDAVGTVVAIGTDVTQFHVGDRVYYAGTTQRPGSNQEFQLVDERLAAIAPTTLSDAEAAAFPLTTITACELLFEKMGFTPAPHKNEGGVLLVINGAGGVGTVLTQAANVVGLTVYATSSPQNFDWLRQNGVNHPLDYHQDLPTQLKTMGISYVDGIAILYDPAPYFDQAATLIAPFGHIGSIVETTQPLPLGKIKNKAASFDWEYMFAKSDYQVNLASQGLALSGMSTAIDTGLIHSVATTVIDSGINATTLRHAHELVESGHTVGKVVVTGPFNG